MNVMCQIYVMDQRGNEDANEELERLREVNLYRLLEAKKCERVEENGNGNKSNCYLFDHVV